MKTPEVIKKGLECCKIGISWATTCAKGCPYLNEPVPGGRCEIELLRDALELIRQLEDERRLVWAMFENECERVVDLEERLHDIEQGWISVAESLPEDDENVVVYTAERGVEAAWFSGTNFWRLRTESLAWGIVPDVTHWMPMPEAPEEGNNDETD